MPLLPDPTQKMDLRAVESRIKAQVAADRAASKSKSEARQRAIQAAMRASGMRDTLLQVGGVLRGCGGVGRSGAVGCWVGAER